MRTILHFLKPHKKLAILSLLFVIFDVAGALYIPTLTADMINNGVNTGNMDYIIQKGILMIAVTIISGIGTLIATHLIANLSAKISRDMRNEIYEKSLCFSSDDFDEFGTGSMITRTLNDINVISQAITMCLQMIIPVPIMCIMGITMAFFIDSFMGLLLLSLTILIIVVAFFITKKASVIFEKLQAFLDKMNVVLRENITGVRVIRAFNKEPYEKKRMKKTFEDYAESAIKANKLFAGLDGYSFLIVNLCIVGILWIGGNRVGSGFIEIGDITALTEYAILILYYIVMAQMVFLLLPREIICVCRIGEVLNKETKIKDGKAKLTKSENNNVIEFQNVSFSFGDSEENTLQNLNFTCKKGETTAIIGSTGSGKSTIAKLIMRFHDVQTGKILLKGQDIRTISQKELREHISYVPQKAWLFSGTIANNLKYGNEKASAEDMKKSLEISQSTFINEIEAGINAKVAQGGTNFSGGQKQRISIARAITKKADMYIFDDSFSALDFKTDSKLRHALTEKFRESSILIIAQRINTILNADQIIVLNDGKIEGIGKHEELIKTCRVYQDIAKSQMKGDENDGTRK